MLFSLYLQLSKELFDTQIILSNFLTTLLNKIAEINSECKIKTYYLSTNQENINNYDKYSNIVAKELNFENLKYIWNDIKKEEKSENKYILLIDDVEEAMMKIKSDKIKIQFDSEENEILIKKAFNMLLLDIFTKVRRYHTLCMCVKTWQTIDIKYL